MRPARRLLPALPALLLIAADEAALAGRVDRLTEKEEWEKATEVCAEYAEKNSGVRDIDMRQACARADLGRTRATAPATDADAFLAVYKRWVGTRAGDEARSLFLGRALKNDWNDRATLQALVDEHANTQGIGPVEDRLHELAFADAKRVGTSQAVAEFRAKYPDSDQEDDAVELQETLAFAEAAAADSVVGWATFLASYPDHAKKSEAQARLRDATWRTALSAGGEALVAFAKRWPDDPRAAEAWRLALPGLLTVEARIQGNALPVWTLQATGDAGFLPADADTFQVSWRGLDGTIDFELVSDDGGGWTPLAQRFQEALVGLGHPADAASWAVTVRRRNEATSIVQTLPAGLCRPAAQTRFAVHVETPQGDVYYPFTVDAACRAAPFPKVAASFFPADTPGDKLDASCSMYRVRNGEVFRGCGPVEAVWPIDGAAFFFRIGDGAPGRPLIPDAPVGTLAVGEAWSVPTSPPLSSAARGQLVSTGAPPNCTAPPLPNGATTLQATEAFVDPEGAAEAVLSRYGGAAVLQADVDLTGDGVVDRVLAIENGAEAWWFLLARTPAGDVRAWPITESTGLRAAWATPFAVKGGRYVAITGDIGGVCGVRVLRWTSGGPSLSWGAG